MAARVVPSANTILEVLNLYNYEDWSTRVKTYLIAEGLWDIVVEAKVETPRENLVEDTAETPTTETEKWTMKNAKALHAIQNSCRADVFGFIRDIETAKNAWETLAKRLKPKNTDIEGMAATLFPRVMINFKALNQDNFEHWSFWVKTYLLNEDLWDVVKGTSEPPKQKNGEGEEESMAWRKNNARALHVITIFCGEDAKSSISGIERAKDAWNTLAEKFEPPEILVTPEKNSEVDSNDNTGPNDGNANLEIERVEGCKRKTYDQLFNYVRHGKCEAVKENIEKHPEAVRVRDRSWGTSMTLFQTAVWYRHVPCVKALLPFMENEDWEIVDQDGHTALSLAIQNTDTDDAREIVQCIVQRNKELLLRVVDPSANTIPLLHALSLDKPKMARDLFSVTLLEKLKFRDLAELVSTGLRLKHLDIPWALLLCYPMLAVTKDHSGESPLNELAGTGAGLFSNASQLGIWKRCIYSCTHIPPRPTDVVSIDVQNEEKDQSNWKHLVRKGIEGIHVQTIDILKLMSPVLKKDNLNYVQHKFVKKAIFQAVERGHAPFIEQILWDNLDGRSWFFTITNQHDKTVFQVAAEHRQNKIFDLIYLFNDKDQRKEIVGRKDKFGNNMLHVLGKLPPLTKIAHIRGAALQMQKELQWFKEVERMANPKDLNCINSDGRTPREEFTMNHRNLVEAGEKSMKETAISSSALVAALIITIMFAATVTVPGGIKGETGIPIYLHTKAFRIFIVADVISLCSSTTSVMIFLGILTSRFAEEDFLTSLPTKLIIGFLTLFLSVGAMMVAFSSAIFIMLPEKPSIVLPSIVLASVPIVSFLCMQFLFLREIIISTYGFKVRRIYRLIRSYNKF
ncbi:uncharacterized protein LOC133722982 [Rosa rugosa]|uniref:uncharacterized protein LOC133722982 n=1 Tax=Rosa rugosa TaxID=74645 RepID=UPI002B400909|nr:uncharacterized protein LOC133722982 [Rosa rugosa]